MPNLGAPPLFAGALRAGVAVLVGVLVFMRWRAGQNDLELRLVEISTLVLLGTFLAFPFSWHYYGLYLVPAAVSVVRPGALMRHPIGWLGLYCVFTLNAWTSSRLPSFANHLLEMLPTLGFMLVLVALGLGILQAASRRSPLPDVGVLGHTIERSPATVASA